MAYRGPGKGPRPYIPPTRVKCFNCGIYYYTALGHTCRRRRY